MRNTEPVRVWTVAEATARLPEVLRLAEEEGPQRIGTRFVVVPAAAWEETVPPRKHLGQWLLENMPDGAEIGISDRSSNRPIPFVDGEAGG